MDTLRLGNSRVSLPRCPCGAQLLALAVATAS